MKKKRTSWEWQPSPDPEIVFLRFPGWLFWPDAPEDEKIIVRVRFLGTKERDALEAFLLPLDLRGFSQRLISLSLVDKEGNRVFSENDEAVLRAASSAPVFALANAILEANVMLPPPDQKVDQAGDSYSIDNLIDSLVDATRSKHPTWSQEKIDEYRRYMESAKSVFSFLRSYAYKYRPGSKARDLLLPHFPEAGDERIAAAERFIGNRSPMHEKRIAQHRAEIWDAFGVTTYAEEKELIKQLGVESFFPVVARLREKLGIWTPDDEMLEKAWSDLREETTHNALPYEGVEDEDGKQSWRKKPTPVDPELQRRHEATIAYKLEVSGIKGVQPPRVDDPHDEGHFEYFVNPFDGLDTALAEEEAAIAVKEERDRLIRELTPRHRRHLNAYLAAEGDYGRAAKKLGIKPRSLEQSIRRIIKAKKPIL